jgi:hypothetical protein
MSSANAILNRNTASETFMDALPALHRAADMNRKHKDAFLLALSYWTTLKEDRHRIASCFNAPDTLKLIEAAQKLAANPKEMNALHVLVSDLWFGPVVYLEEVICEKLAAVN